MSHRPKIWHEQLLDYISIIIGRPYKTSGIRPLLYIMYYVLLVYLIGLSISYMCSFEALYITSLPILFYLIGSISTGYAIYNFTNRYPVIFSRAFSKIYDGARNKLPYEEVMKIRFAMMYDNMKIIKFSVIISITLSLIGSIMWYNYDKMPLSVIESNVYFIKDKEWYLGSYTIFKIFVINILGYVVIFLLVTLAMLMINNILAINKMTRYKYIPLPIVIPRYFENMLKFNMRVASLWFWGVLLFVIMEYPNYTLVYNIFIFTLIVIGILFAILPYSYLNKIFESTKKSHINNTVVKLKERKQTTGHFEADWQSISMIDSTNKLALASNKMIYLTVTNNIMAIAITVFKLTGKLH